MLLSLVVHHFLFPFCFSIQGPGMLPEPDLGELSKLKCVYTRYRYGKNDSNTNDKLWGVSPMRKGRAGNNQQ